MHVSEQNPAFLAARSQPEVTNNAEVIEAAGMVRELMDNYDGTAPSYPQVKKAYYNGRIPGWKSSTGRWVTAREDRDAVAAAFGMKPKAEQVAA